MGIDIPEEAGVPRIPRKGEILSGKYRIEQIIGIGGMGAVLEATKLADDTRVAIKIMLPHLVKQAEFAARFVREVHAAAALSSEHVARVLEVGWFENGQPYLVMELLEGADLDKMILERGPLPIGEAVGYLIEACDAVAEAHARGIIHRDLKPSNLFVAQRSGAPPILKVLDFGISKPMKVDPEATDIRAITGTDTTLGSPQYMSPEQFRSSRRVDTRTDIWSLGMILHRMLTGKVAFEATSIAELLTMLVGEAPTPLRARRPDAPPALEAVILRCLEKDVARRFQNVGQIVIALAPFAPRAASVVLPRVVSLLGAATVTAPPPQLLPPEDPVIFDAPSTPASYGPAELPPAPPARTPSSLVGLTLVVSVAVMLIVIGVLEAHRFFTTRRSAAPSAPEPSAVGLAPAMNVSSALPDAEAPAASASTPR
jgi:eukaryotic-like serine/threonine-protein kinase